MNFLRVAPTEIRDAQGNSLKLLRDEQRNLLEIRTPNRHSIKLKYDEQSRIARAQDDQGNWAKYAYNENGMLADVFLSSGHQRHYFYEGLLMTVVEDENRKILLRNSYEYGALKRQQFGNGQIYSYSYRGSPKASYAETIEVTLPDSTKINVGTGDSVPEYVKNPPH